MRVAVATRFGRKIGGVETYLETVLPALRAAGLDVAFLSQEEGPTDRPRLNVLTSGPFWSAAELGTAAALAGLCEWSPDVIFNQGFLDLELEAELLAVAPAILFAHNYHGTCISGQKTTALPVVQPCHRTFGPLCLLHYFPHRCGGLNPMTMMRLYRDQRRRLALLPRYRRVLTFSEHMRQEYLRHGLAPERVCCLPYVGGWSMPSVSRTATAGDEEIHLLFLGRMDHLKSGDVLIDALPAVAAALGKPLHLVMAGDGPQFRAWQDRADRMTRRHPGIRADFPGWVSPRNVEQLLSTASLLVVPSRWPEPFGLVGLEAARYGVPAVAFDVGGVREWLRDGTNGLLAPGNPPTVAGLADAIVRCLRDSDRYEQFRAGAQEMARQFVTDRHLASLTYLLRQAATAEEPSPAFPC